MSKVFKVDKAGRDALLLSVASKFATATGWAIKESDRMENYVFLDPTLKMKAYNEGVRFCVQSSAKTVNMCLEVYSRKDDEVKVHAFAAKVSGAYTLGTEVAGLTVQWKVIYKGGLLRVAIPANKTDDEIVEIMKQFKNTFMNDYNEFMADVSPAEAAAAPKVKKAQVVATEVPVTEEPVAAPVEGVIDEVEVPPVVEAEQDLA
jgi:hypothetical protein